MDVAVVVVALAVQEVVQVIAGHLAQMHVRLAVNQLQALIVYIVVAAVVLVAPAVPVVAPADVMGVLDVQVAVEDALAVALESAWWVVMTLVIRIAIQPVAAAVRLRVEADVIADAAPTVLVVAEDVNPVVLAVVLIVVVQDRHVVPAARAALDIAMVVLADARAAVQRAALNVRVAAEAHVLGLVQVTVPVAM